MIYLQTGSISKRLVQPWNNHKHVMWQTNFKTFPRHENMVGQ